MVEQIEIRPLHGQDEAQACAHYMANTSPWNQLGMSYDLLLRSLTDETKDVYVAADGDAPVGLIVIDMRGSFVGYIKSLGVFPGWQGRGVGHRLLAFAEESIFGRSPNMFICVSSFNPRAQRLYENFGFSVVGRLTNYVVNGHDEILLRKTIAPLSDFRKR